MKNIIIFLVVIVFAGVCVLATDPNSLEVRQAELSEKVAELKVMEQDLTTKIYTGTIDEVLRQRIADVCEVRQVAVDVNAIAPPLCTDMNLPGSSCQVIGKIVCEKKTTLETKQQNNEFLSAVIECLNDPNILPDPNDPNYAAEIQRNLEFMNVCFEVAEPR
ncbi:MAG TPA: hypothetical protein DDW84_01430 [Phycisphaerales bacterium]|nr:MAG: hypothetical protein A2Y13_01225 [Planctomycetes bacterium GWC2_45_44]HBG77498.1 hypothetical protein [Phycisphaerales bacterium]HBR19106.1 hypothetical protein [Phycisphaerales bacterium]